MGSPDTLDAFIELCQTIESAGIRAIQPSLRYTDAVRQFFVGLNDQELFSGVENYDWLQSYGEEKAKISQHIGPGFDTIERFLDAGILRPGILKYSPALASQMMYYDHMCAMVLETQMAPVYFVSFGNGKQHEIGMMPFFSGGKESDYLLFVPNFYIGVNAKLEERDSEEKLYKALEILEWLSTVEGQESIIVPSTPTISSVKGVSLYGSDFFSDVAVYHRKGTCGGTALLDWPHGQGTEIAVSASNWQTVQRFI